MTAIELTALARSKIAFWQTVKAAYGDTFGKLLALLPAAALPFALSVLVEVFLPELLGSGMAVLRAFLNTLIVSIFELVWLRYLLLGREGSPRLAPPPDRRLLRFAGYSLLLTLPVLPAMFMQAVLAQPSLEAPQVIGAMTVVLYLVGSYFWVRFAFVFPWIALDAPERLVASWRATRRNGLRILIAIVLVGLPLLLPLFAFGALLSLLAPDLATALEEGRIEGALWWVLLAGSQVLLFLYYALSTAVLARAFSDLTGWLRHLNELLERFE
jgi:hypothetical protein